MTKKHTLSLVDQPPAKKPTLEAARSRLGGRVGTDVRSPAAPFAPGRVVTYALPSGKRRTGVIVYAGDDEIHVLLDPMRLRRLKAEELAAHDSSRDGAVDEELQKLAADAHVFGRLSEGQAIRYADDGGSLVAGRLIEKCRWGGLVARDDGAIVAIGFRKLWPAPPGSAPES